MGTVMRISTFWFCMKQGLVNICRNIWFSLASTAIISACIFLFCVFFSVITNIEYMVRTAETTMGITVFFDENLTEDEIKEFQLTTSRRGRRENGVANNKNEAISTHYLTQR